MTLFPKKRPAVIAALHDAITKANPCLPGVRGRNKIAEVTSAALADAGLLTLPDRAPRQKQPKASNLDELTKITEAQLRGIVKKWECQENVRAVLLQKGTSEDENPRNGKVDNQDIAALCAALIAAMNEAAVSPDEMGSIRQLVVVAKRFLDGSAPKKQRKPRTVCANLASLPPYLKSAGPSAPMLRTPVRWP